MHARGIGKWDLGVRVVNRPRKILVIYKPVAYVSEDLNKAMRDNDAGPNGFGHLILRIQFWWSINIRKEPLNR